MSHDLMISTKCFDLLKRKFQIFRVRWTSCKNALAILVGQVLSMNVCDTRHACLSLWTNVSPGTHPPQRKFLDNSDVAITSNTCLPEGGPLAANVE